MKVNAAMFLVLYCVLWKTIKWKQICEWYIYQVLKFTCSKSHLFMCFEFL